MAKKTVTPVDPDQPSTPSSIDLVNALVQAIETTKPPQKKTPANRKKNTPWTPKDGSARLKLRRKMFQHGLPLTTRVSNDEIELLNKVKPGSYCDGHVRVVKRRDKGIDIDYPVKTAAQRLKLVNQFGVRNFKELLQRIVDEGTNPKVYADPEDDE